MNVEELVKAFKSTNSETIYIFLNGDVLDSFYVTEIDMLIGIYGQLKVKSFEMDGDFKIHI